MPIDKETVKKVAKLAKIKISETEETNLIVELNNILGWVDELKKVDTENTEPMLSVFNESMIISLWNLFGVQTQITSISLSFKISS